jgi:hypothetical protein
MKTTPQTLVILGFLFIGIISYSAGYWSGIKDTQAAKDYVLLQEREDEQRFKISTVCMGELLKAVFDVYDLPPNKEQKKVEHEAID